MMVKTINWILPLLMALLVAGCIEQIDIRLHDEYIVPVIDGRLTDQKGGHYIKLSYSLPLSENNYKPIYGASVILYDENDNQEIFVEFDSGTYVSTASFALIGNTRYTLEVIIGQDEYIAENLTLKTAPPIKNVAVKESNISVLSYNNQVVQKRGITLSAVIENPEKTENYFKYEIVPTHMVVAERAEEISPYKTCYITNGDNTFSILRDRSGGYNHDITFVGFSDKFLHRISFLVRQLSMSAEAFIFWEKVEAFRENTGGLFDRPHFTIKGNMKHRTDPEKEMLGLVGLYAISEHRIFMSQYDLSYALFVDPEYCYPIMPPVPPECFNCLAYNGKIVTNSRPAWWR